jgi:NAD(P)-dependent dehydrogenase (short-subunit alcohol dehydrogenase family)
VRVNCICPHTVATEAVRARIAELEASDSPLPSDLRGELIDPDALAGTVVDLIGDDTLSGRVLVVRGGEPVRLLAVEQDAVPAG